MPDTDAAVTEAPSGSVEPGDIVIITGKGTDPYIMGPKGSKIKWDDAQVAREEFAKILAKEEPRDSGREA